MGSCPIFAEVAGFFSKLLDLGLVVVLCVGKES